MPQGVKRPRHLHQKPDSARGTMDTMGRNIRRGWGIVRPLIIWICSIAIAIGIIFAGIRYVNNNLLSAVDKNDRHPISFTVQRGWSLSKIASELKDAGLVRNSGAFKYYVDFTDRTGSLKAGTFLLSKSMTYDEICDIITSADARSPVVNIRITEGTTAKDIAELLYKQGVFAKTDTFLNLCKDGKAFTDFPFVKKMLDDGLQKKRQYILEGHLFPDTYEFYSDATEEDVIRKLLSRFNDIYYNGKNQERAKAIHMTDEQVLTLASMIEKEARPSDFAKVSAVFHNRLDKKMMLQSCVTVQYVLGIKTLNLSDEQISVDSLYNTYKVRGLPVGPVSNPSRAAIEAALYPDETFAGQGYLYFCSKDPATGELAFAKTLSEHNTNVSKYRHLWK